VAASALEVLKSSRLGFPGKRALWLAEARLPDRPKRHNLTTRNPMALLKMVLTCPASPKPHWKQKQISRHQFSPTKMSFLFLSHSSGSHVDYPLFCPLGENMRHLAEP